MTPTTYLWNMDIQTKVAHLVAGSKVVFAVFMAAIGWPLLSAWLNSASRLKDLEAWERWALKNPRLAAWAERFRALGLDPKKLLEIARREATRKAGEMPGDALMKLHLPPQVTQILSNEAKRKQLVDFIMKMVDEQPEKPQSLAAESDRPSEDPPPVSGV
jgi:hypothetical protein